MKTILKVDNLNAFYDSSHVVFDVCLEVGKGQGVALLGRNGAGKSSTLKSIMGFVRKTGRITYHDQDISQLKPFEIARRGVGYVPEERRIYPDLTVIENLMMGMKAARKRATPMTAQEIWGVFPLLCELKKRKGKTLSGGEQQLLSVARSLVGRPELLLLDEPAEGLAPLLVRHIGGILFRLRQEHGVSFLLAEQNMGFSLKHTERVYVIDSGTPVFRGSSQEFKVRRDLHRKYLAV